jgi:hypothetical protein
MRCDKFADPVVERQVPQKRKQSGRARGGCGVQIQGRRVVVCRDPEWDSVVD